MADESSLQRHRSSFLLHRFLLSLLFLAPRLALLFTRKPFFDELYTRWIGAKSFAGILAALHYDSGPPLYYFLVHALGDPSVLLLRVLSLLFAFAAFLLLLLTERVGAAKYWAAALLALYPPAVLLSVDARAYALCALFVAFGVLAIDADRPFAAALSFVFAAYCHYYGVLFFPLLLMIPKGSAAATGPELKEGVAEGLPTDAAGRAGRRPPTGVRHDAVVPYIGAVALAGALFVPGFLLAAHQPAAAMAWAQERVPLSLSFAGRYASLLLDPPMALVVASLVLLVVAVLRAWRFAPYVLVPLGLTVLFAAFGRNVYFPLRFEAVVAVPLMLWIATSLARWPRNVRIALGTALMTIGAFVITAAAIDHSHRPVEGCVAAARFIRANVEPELPVVASQYCYLYAVSELGDRVTAFPAEQALHPGWWRPLTESEAPEALRQLPRGEFVWLGQTASEMSVLMRNRRIESAVVMDATTRLLRVGPDRLH